MADISPITADYLRSRLAYEQTTGVFRWKPRPELTDQHRPWNTKYAGTVAGCVGAAGYIVIRIDGKNYRAHRLAWLHVHGEWPPGFLDHKDCDKLNNRFDNLRPASFADSSRNQRRPRSNTSGLKGVCWNEKSRKWQAGIKVNRRSIHLGLFDDREEAAAAYAAAAKKYHGRFGNAG